MRRTFLLLLWLFPLPAIAVPPADSPRHTPVVQAVGKATPAVVAIEVEVPVRSPFFRFGSEARRGEGSGVIIADDGIILTNAHVVDGASTVKARLADGRSFDARVVALDAGADLAVLRIDGAQDLPTLPLGESDDVMLGETVIAIGNPLGLGLTVSTGVVASTARDLPVGDGPVQTWIQTDAAINPGNSGGALIDLEGNLIGINTFIRRDAEGIGFAIPVARARKVAGDLIAFGEVQLPWLGFTLMDVPAGRRGHPGASSAVVVRRVDPSGPAASAGIGSGDVILEVEGHVVTSRADVNARLSDRSPGQRVRLALQGRDDEVPVGSRRAPDDAGRVVLDERLGVELHASSSGLVAAKVEREGAWGRAGLTVGDVLVAVDGRPVGDVVQVVDALARAVGSHRPSIWATVARGRYRGTLELTF